MTSTRSAELAAALSAVNSRIEAAARSCGRAVEEIELLPVTKFFPATDVIELRRLGCHQFGESREQEGSRKAAEVASAISDSEIRWHMVGRIQRNKARAIAGWAHTVHAVDNLPLVGALDRAAARAVAEGRRSTPLNVYVQVSLDGDPDRGGADIGQPEVVDQLCGAVSASAGLGLVGLMAIPPLSWSPDVAFARLAAERDRVQSSHQQRLGLSAGMSGDLEAAIRHGSTCVRVGTALMGQRPLPSP